MPEKNTIKTKSDGTLRRRKVGAVQTMSLRQAVNLPSNVVSMQLVKSVRKVRPQLDLIHVLKNMLEAAQKGEMTGLVYCAEANGEVHSAAMTGSFCNQPMASLGAVVTIKGVLDNMLGMHVSK